MNTLLDHRKRIYALDGTYLLDTKSGHYERYEPDPPSRYPVLILIGACIAAWGLVLGIAYAIYRALSALGWG
jgi:hypothetical protein